ncbi:MAG: PQQ-binding-like beta-propeller repeat protein [Planctomycetota bacterium]|nr:PQQ-binding-like beta-propeller repeat protein [Planctomycetota bacterium]
MHRLLTLFAAILLIHASAIVQAAPASPAGNDWPTYMHDNSRSGVTREALPFPLSERWTYRSPAPPKTAWPESQGNVERRQQNFDDALYTVAVGESVYFGSSVDHQVYALDAATGMIRWRFFADGPVRLAPTVAQGRVHFGSDDGVAYCLDAADGKPLWTLNAAPDDRRVVGNGRIISLWPVRTDLMVDGDKVFFGSGIFPYHSPALFAADAKTGKQIPWAGLTPKAWLGLSPQGYLLRHARGLVIPNGRSVPIVVDALSGNPPYEKARLPTHQKFGGGDYGFIAEDILYYGSQNSLYTYDLKTGADHGEWLAAHRLIVAPDACYALSIPPLLPPLPSKPAPPPTGITAYSRDGFDLNKAVDNDAIAARMRWRNDKPGAVAMILAGDHLIVGYPNEVASVDTRTGKEDWSAKVDGDAVGLTVARGRLLVSTTRGVIHCFSEGAPGKVTKATAASAPPSPADNAATVTPSAETQALAAAILRDAAAHKGFALITSPGSAALACELARKSELHVTCLEPDAEQRRLARLAVDAAGLYGHRVSVDAGTPDRLPYPDYAANLIVHLERPGQPAPAAPEILRVLKPCGGVLLVGHPASESPAKGLAASVNELDAKAGVWSHDLTIVPGAQPWSRLLRGQLPGSGWWTHNLGDSGNTGSSGDQLVKGPLSVLWFGEPGPGEAPDRHMRSVAPLANNGRVFMQGWTYSPRRNIILCFDAYNGVRLWEREIPDALRMSLPGVAGNLACSDDSLFVAAGPKCHRLDAVTGETKAIYETPAEADGSHLGWNYLAVSGGLLVGSTVMPDFTPDPYGRRRTELYGGQNSGSRYSGSLFAIDLATGKPRWAYKGKEIRDTTIAFAAGKVLFAENRGSPTTRPSLTALTDEEASWHEGPEPDDEPAPDAKFNRLGAPIQPDKISKLVRFVVALDAATGKPAWEKEVDLTGCGRWEASSPSLHQAEGYRELQALSNG